MYDQYEYNVSNYLRLPNCSFLDWLELYLNKKLMRLVNDLFREQKMNQKKEPPMEKIRSLMTKKSNQKIQWNPPIKVIGKKELEITFTYQDEYQKAIQLIQLAEQTSQRKVG